MIDTKEIHHSIIDANDLEEIREGEIAVRDVFRSLASHPFQIVSRWNWKSAMMGAMLRALFYFFSYKASGEKWIVIMTAVVVEFSFRFFTSGISGALVQSFRRATPKWVATLIIIISLPIFSHTVEFLTHYVQEVYYSHVFAASENNSRRVAFAISVLFSVLSAMFNIFIMRNGVLLVGAGEESKPFLTDMKLIPRLINEFITYIPLKIIAFARKGNLIGSLGMFLSFGLTVGAVLGISRGKWSWTWKPALGALVVMFVWTIFVGTFMYFKRKHESNQ